MASADSVNERCFGRRRQQLAGVAKMLRNGSVAVAMIVLATFGVASGADATVFHPATNPIIDGKKIANWATTPTYDPLNSWFSDISNVDIGSQSPANVRLVLGTATWIGSPLTFVSGGACTVAVNCTTGPNNSGTWTYSGTEAKVFGIHFGNNFIALLFADALTGFSITGLSHGVSNIYAYNVATTPLPAALALFGSGLGLLGFVDWLRRRRSTVS
jgi:hypothetical protein